MGCPPHSIQCFRFACWVGASPSARARCDPSQRAQSSAELASLRAHREWADTRIAQLIRRAGDAERPLREEAARLCQVVQSLRVRPPTGCC